MVLVTQYVSVVVLYSHLVSVGFFEDCIAEEQYEAQKLDIMRDALRAKATYTLTSKHLENTPLRESPEPVSPTTTTAPLSPVKVAPITVFPTTTTATAEATTTSASNGETVANGSESAVGSEGTNDSAVSKSVEGSAVTANGGVNEGTNGSKVGDEGCQQENEITDSNGTVANGILAAV